MKKELLRKIHDKEVQLAKLASLVDRSFICSELYNKVVVEKAVLKKQYDDLCRNKFADKIVRLFPRKKTLICDYFHE